jgi:hypothetical protein
MSSGLREPAKEACQSHWLFFAMIKRWKSQHQCTAQHRLRGCIIAVCNSSGSGTNNHLVASHRSTLSEQIIVRK